MNNSYERLHKLALEVRIMIRRNPAQSYTSTDPPITTIEGWMIGEDSTRGLLQTQYYGTGGDYEQDWGDHCYILDTSGVVWGYSTLHNEKGGGTSGTVTTHSSYFWKLDAQGVNYINRAQFDALIAMLERLS